MVHTIADDFAREVATLCATTVTPTQWERFLDAQVPPCDASSGQPLKGWSLTIADRKRDALNRLYRYDDRVAPWAGTVQGVVKAVNTYEHDESTVRGAARPERNMLRAVTGDFGRLDRATLATLEHVLA